MKEAWGGRGLKQIGALARHETKGVDRSQLVHSLVDHIEDSVSEGQ